MEAIRNLNDDSIKVRFPLIDTLDGKSWKSGLVKADLTISVNYYSTGLVDWDEIPTGLLTLDEVGTTGEYELTIGLTDSDFDQADLSRGIGVKITGADIDVQGIEVKHLTEANIKAIEDNTTDGNNATLNLKKLNIINPDTFDEAVNIEATGSNSDGVKVFGALHGLYTEGEAQAGLRVRGVNAMGAYITGSARGIEVSGGTDGVSIVGSSSHGVRIVTADSSSDGLNIGGGANGKAINAKELGAVFNIDGVTNAGILDVLKKIVDNNGGADFSSATDSLHELQGTVVEGVPENEVATAETITVGTVDAGTYTDTHTKNDVYLQVSPTGAAVFDFYLSFQIEDKLPSSLLVNGRTESGAGTRWTNVFAYDFNGGAWDQISGASNRIEETTLDQDYVFPAGSRVAVSGNTAKILQQSRFAPHFDIFGDFSRHFGEFSTRIPSLSFSGQAPARSSGGCC